MVTGDADGLSRRAFISRTGGALAGGMLLTGSYRSVQSSWPTEANSGPLPCRILGKTRQSVTALALGTGACGQSNFVSTRQIADLVDEALSLGINFIDTARLYGNAEEGIGLALGRRRPEVFLATKVWADTIADAETSLSASLKTLRTDHVDLLCFHNLGTRGADTAMAPGGVYAWLLKQKQAGKTRLVGISADNLSERFPPLIASGDVDVVMMPLNLVDRYIYDFEAKVLPLARRHDVGIVATKVFGGVRGGFRSYGGPPSPPQMPQKYLEPAIRYALSLPGVAALNIGVHDLAQLRNNVAMVKSFRPLSANENEQLAKLGRRLATNWRPHFGPAATVTS